MVKLLTPRDVSAVIGLGRTTTYKLIDQGVIPSIRVGARTVRVPEPALLEWIERSLKARDVDREAARLDERTNGTVVETRRCP